MLKDLRLWCPPIVTFYHFYAIEWLNVMKGDIIEKENLKIFKMLFLLLVNVTSFCGLKMLCLYCGFVTPFF